MPLGTKPSCAECNMSEVSLWEKTENGEILCSKCFILRRTMGVTSNQTNSIAGSSETIVITERSMDVDKIERESSMDVDTHLPLSPSRDSVSSVSKSEPTTDDVPQSFILVGDSCVSETTTAGSGTSSVKDNKDVLSDAKLTNRSASLVSTRKSCRVRPAKAKQANISKAIMGTKGRGRRIVFKRNPIKASASVATVVTRDNIFHNGLYWQVGDIVSILDEDGDGIYYAQLRGFLQDQYLEKSAVITWLIPTGPTDLLRFCPADYILGPEEDVPRKMKYFEFVCHAPSDYYRSHDAPLPVMHSLNQPELGFIWTRLGQPRFETLTNITDILTREDIPSLVDGSKSTKSLVVNKNEKEIAGSSSVVRKQSIKEKQR